MTQSIELTLPWPPTVNTYWRHVGARTILSENGRRYKHTICQQALIQAWPKFGTARLAVEIEAWVPDKRRRDLDNLPKSILDALGTAGVWADDEQIDDLRIWRGPQVAKGMVKVRIMEVA